MKAVLILDKQNINFFPLSSEDKSLSLIPTSLNSNLLSIMYSLINSYFSKDKIFVVCTKNEYDDIIESIPDICPDNIIVEPVRISYNFSLFFANLILNNIYPDSIVFYFPINFFFPDNLKMKNWILSVGEMAEKDWIITPSTIIEKNEIALEYIDGGKNLTNVRGVDFFNINKVVTIDDKKKSKGVFKKNIFGKEGRLLNIFCGKTSIIQEVFLSNNWKTCEELNNILHKECFGWNELLVFYQSIKDIEPIDIFVNLRKILTIFLDSKPFNLENWSSYISRFSTKKNNCVFFGNIVEKNCENIICFNFDEDEIDIDSLNNLIIIKKYGNITIRNITNL